jgi:glycosyltransferase involved in cell wall biosynthesis
MTECSVDLLFPAFNRLEFTQQTFAALLENTDWRYIQCFTVYDDGSADGTRQWLQAAVRDVPAPVVFRESRFVSPVKLMLDWIARTDAPMLAKCDSDAIYPPGWLTMSLSVMDRFPALDFLGIEAMYEASGDETLARRYEPAPYISGLGLYKRSAFERDQPTPIGRYWGLEEWQMAKPQIRRGWIRPALPVFLLDRMPIDPWRSLSDKYIAKGWQRPWKRYGMESAPLWKWWMK